MPRPRVRTALERTRGGETQPLEDFYFNRRSMAIRDDSALRDIPSASKIVDTCNIFVAAYNRA